MTTLRTMAAVAACAAALSFPGRALTGDDASGGTALGKWLDGAKVDLAAAIDMGVKEAGEGVVFHAEIEEDGGRVVWSIDVAQGTKTVNVVLDAGDGHVVEKDVDAEEDHSKTVAACTFPLKEAAVKALSAVPGRAAEAKLAVEGGKPVVLVRVVRVARVLGVVGEVGEGGPTVVRLDGVSGSLLLAPPGAPPSGEPRFTDVFRVEADEWSSTGDNPWFPLEPGRVLVLVGREDGGEVRLTVTVLAETKVVDGVETRVVEEREEAGGQLVEVSRNYFAASKKTRSVYYFGEDVDVYEGGKVASHPGSWLAGENGARFGLMMPGTPLLGARYFQEVAPGIAMDRAEVVDLSETVETPAGRFEGCLRTSESTPLEKGVEPKRYAPGVGLIGDAALRLVEVRRPR